MTGWQFPHNGSKEEEGLADAGIETFKDATLSGIAREVHQAATFVNNINQTTFMLLCVA